MKHPHAEKIMQFARMVESGHPIDKLVHVKFWKFGEFTWVEEPTPRWSSNNEYRVARAFVEGKPVFEGDGLYHKNGDKWTVIWSDNEKISAICEDKPHQIVDFVHCFSWNKPEEKINFKDGDDCICEPFIAAGLGKIGGKCKILSAEHNAKIVFPNGFQCSVDYSFLRHYTESKEQKKQSFDDAIKAADNFANRLLMGGSFYSNGNEYRFVSVRSDPFNHFEEITIRRMFDHTHGRN